VRGDSGVISPDGRYVAFERGPSFPRGRQIWIVGTDGSGERELVREGGILAWAPDGETLLAYHGRRLIAIDVVDGDETVLVDRLSEARLYGWSFSPDSRSLVYASAKRSSDWGICGDRIDLYRVDLDGENRRRLTRDDNSAYPIWTRRGIFYSHRPGRIRPAPRFVDCLALGIWRMNADGSGARPIVRRAPRRYCCFGGVYGLRPYGRLRDGRLLIGIRSEWGDIAAVLDPATRRIRSLEAHLDDVSRDGRFVLGLQGGAEGPFDIAIVRVSDGRRRVVARGAVCCPDWNR
jgi:Tol biopolymer transport system component